MDHHIFDAARDCNSQPTRRNFLHTTATAATGLFVGSALTVPGNRVRAAEENAARKRALRLAHLTDVHVWNGLRAGQGMAASLRHAQSLDDPPGLIVTGGDAINDALARDKADVQSQWRLWQSVLKDHCRLPTEHVIGNHDIWGWDKQGSKTRGNEPGWGKQWAMDEFGLSAPYRSFDRGGWHFIALDSTHSDPQKTYIARLDEAQWAWLQDDLKKVDAGTPVCIVSHIPIVSVAVVEFAGRLKYDRRALDGSTHQDAGRIVALLRKHPNVKLCLSGHLHLTERLEYGGVTYYCSGAVCGAWWKGDHHQTDEGYALVDLFNNGTFDVQYVAYGWEVQG